MSEFMEIIEWFDETGQGMAHRFPQDGSGALKMGAQLVVRESQEAIFFKSGRALDRFGAGRHVLSTANLPLLTSALSLPWGFRSPFRAEVVFVNRKVFTDLKWGTQEPVVFRDASLGHVRLRAFGNYTLRVIDVVAFVNELVGTAGHFATGQLEGYLRDVIVARLNDHLGENLASVFDLPAQYDETGAALRAKLAPDFGKYGLELVDFFVQSITPPEEVQRIVDQQGGLSLIKDMPSFLQYQMANALARGQGGGATDSLIGAGLGVGVGVMMPGLVREAMLGGRPPAIGGQAAALIAGAPAGGAAAQATGAAAAPVFCHDCGGGLPAGARFCPGCGARARGDGA